LPQIGAISHSGRSKPEHNLINQTLSANTQPVSFLIRCKIALRNSAAPHAAGGLVKVVRLADPGRDRPGELWLQDQMPRENLFPAMVCSKRFQMPTSVRGGNKERERRITTGFKDKIARLHLAAESWSPSRYWLGPSTRLADQVAIFVGGLRCRGAWCLIDNGLFAVRRRDFRLFTIDTEFLFPETYSIDGRDRAKISNQN